MEIDLNDSRAYDRNEQRTENIGKLEENEKRKKITKRMKTKKKKNTIIFSSFFHIVIIFSSFKCPFFISFNTSNYDYRNKHPNAILNRGYFDVDLQIIHFDQFEILSVK